MLKHTVCRSRQLSAKSIDKVSKLHVAYRLAQQQCVESFIQALHHQVQCKASDAVV
ncbi:unnamed protein product [Staurois parvus]|uniref:Uncharacterized protein n=1 Tax=Staurois parvus TaxID=386267 RepID=A0ABN9DA55_9NEOB|nr:unnamed protein product [Staurois parvus]